MRIQKKDQQQQLEKEKVLETIITNTSENGEVDDDDDVKKGDDLNHLIVDNGLNINNFNEMNAFFIEQDKKRIIEHIDNTIIGKKWEEHCQILRDYVNAPSNMDTEEIVKFIKYPPNTPLIWEFNNKSDVGQFVKVLVVKFKGFKLDQDSEDEDDQSLTETIGDDECDDECSLNKQTGITCKYMIENNETMDPLHCPIYYGMK